MADDISNRTSFESCTQVELPCKEGTYYLNPCSCECYYRCTENRSVLLECCEESKSWDHNNNKCTKLNVHYIKNVCNPYEPWTLCFEDTQKNPEKNYNCEVKWNDSIPQVNQPSSNNDNSSSKIVLNTKVLHIMVASVAVIIIIFTILFVLQKRGHINRCRKKLKKSIESDNSKQTPPDTITSIDYANELHMYDEIQDNEEPFGSIIDRQLRPKLPMKKALSAPAKSKKSNSLPELGPTPQAKILSLSSIDTVTLKSKILPLPNDLRSPSPLRNDAEDDYVIPEQKQNSYINVCADNILLHNKKTQANASNGHEYITIIN